MDRRNFLKVCGVTAASTLVIDKLQAAEIKNNPKIKPIVGSWFEFQHHSSAEGKYWNSTIAQFTTEDWKAKVKEIADLGFEYLVLLDVAIYGKAFYKTELQPFHDIRCQDPIEAVLSAADEYGVKFFISNDFWGDWTNPEFLMKDPAISKMREKSMEEVAARYSHHKSFYGWYYPNETGIVGHYDDFFIKYVNDCTKKAKSLTPKAVNLIAPYGTRDVKADDKFVKQLEMLDIDICAYQDEIGVEKSTVEETAKFYEALYKVHTKAGRSRLWADVEVFRFERKVYDSALLPAEWSRVIRQLENVSPFVENILIYQYEGMMNKPGSNVFAGHPDSVNLYNGYTGWLKSKK